METDNTPMGSPKKNGSTLKRLLPYLLCVCGILLGALIGWIMKNRFYVDQNASRSDTAMVIVCVVCFAFLIWAIYKRKKLDEEG